MTGHEIRTKYLEFFRSKGHKIAVSDSLVPKDDPTVLFTTAGMQQFKPQFMGHLTGFTKAASSQKCLRTDDLPEVGVTDFHHTMFEMLGNFSFGDYFKREAINWGWEFLTSVMNIAPDKLWVSVNKDDEEAYLIWLNEIKVPANRIVKLGDKSNFWPSNARLNGPNGPCGPCSEIFFDWGKNDCKNPDCNPDCSCGRFCEVWNLVFTQYNRKDGGVLEPLPAKNIDTGMGLERLTAVMQGKRNNFESDLFQPIIAAIEKALTAEKVTISLREKRVIADHIRAVTFGLSDGVIPSNEGRGYVMRRLIVDMTNILVQAGIKKPLIHTLVASVIDVMKGPYPELIDKQKDIESTVKRVEEAVIKLNAEKVPEFISELGMLKAGSDRAAAPQKVGELMFRYRDTYGLPVSLIQNKVQEIFGDELLKQAGTICDELMNEQKERSRAGSKMQGDVFLAGDVDVKGLPKTIFLGYDQPSADVTIKAIFVDGKAVPEARDVEHVAIVLDQTPFYAEQGGQCADTGYIKTKIGTVLIVDTQKRSDVYIHRGTLKGQLKTDEMAQASIDGERRMAIMRNHTATHLLQAALRQVLGGHVKQQGSAVDQDRLRFDFTHPKAVSKEELERIEDVVNSCVRRCDQVAKKVMTIEEAQKSGALAFFAEKYGETVRVVTVGDYSKEFCGGTHLDCAGQIGLFKIISESAVAQGIRRIEALTGTGALAFVRGEEEQLEKAAGILKSPVDELVGRVEAQARRLKELEKENVDLRFKVLRAELSALPNLGEPVRNFIFIKYMFSNESLDVLKPLADSLKGKSTMVVLASKNAEDVSIVIAVGDDLVARGLKAGDVAKKVASVINGNGGGRPQFAQAGGKDTARIPEAMDVARKALEEVLAK